MTQAIKSLWLNWAVAVGLLTALATFAPNVPRQWVAPINVVAFILLQIYYVRSRSKRIGIPVCSRLIDQVKWVIVITAIASALLYVAENSASIRHLIEPELNRPLSEIARQTGPWHLYELTGQPYTDTTPMLVILFTAPLTAIINLCFWLNRKQPYVCKVCHLQYGNVVQHGFVGDLYDKEWRFQTGLLFFLSMLLSVADWTYYMLQYVNVNLNRADIFFFIALPCVFYVLSLIYLGFRYYSLWAYYCVSDSEGYVANPGVTKLRYLIICDDRLFLHFYPTEMRFANGAAVKRFDTPAIATEPYHKDESLATASILFHKVAGFNPSEIRLIYESPDPVTFRNIFHYFAFVDDPQALIDSPLQGEWFNWGNLNRLSHEGILDRDLVSELRHIYNVATTWKSYDRKGNRLYPVKHYKPTFRIKDIRGWDVDYNDHGWLRVWRLNQDKPFYRLRRLFSRKHD